MRELGPEVVVSRSRGLPLYLPLILGVVQGLALVLFGIKGAAVTLGAAYIYAVFRWPHLALIATLVVIVDGLGFISVDFVRVPGVFRLKDLMFLSLFLPLFFNRKWQRRAERIFHDCRILVFPILVILVLTTLQMVRTSFEYDLPLVSCINAGRHYWYYAYVPLTAIYLDTSYKRESVFRISMVVIAALASVVIIQTAIYAAFKIRLVSDSVQFGEANFGNMKFFRLYLEGEPLLVLGFALAFWGLSRRKSTRETVGYAAMASLCALAILFVNSRMRWAHSLLVVLIPMFALGPHIRRAGGQVRYRLLILVLVLISLFVLTFHSNLFVSGIVERGVSAWTDFGEKKGTWEYRLEDNQFRIELIREHPFFGLGFVYVDYAPRFGAGEVVDLDRRPSLQQGVSPGVTSPDSGLVSLLVSFGAIGAIWAMWYLVSILRFCFKVMTSAEIGVLHWMSIAVIGYMTAGVLTFVTLSIFTMPGDIIGHSFVLGMLGAGAHLQLRSGAKRGYV
jgi:hypothetical protein